MRRAWLPVLPADKVDVVLGKIYFKPGRFAKNPIVTLR